MDGNGLKKCFIYSLFAFSVLLSSILFLLKINDLNNFHSGGMRVLTASSVGTVPMKWYGPVGDVSEKVFDFGFLNTFDGLEDDLYLYIPAFEQDVRFKINGNSVPVSSSFIGWNGPASVGVALVRLPQEHLLPTFNYLEVAVISGPSVFGSLSAVYLGRSADFSSHFLIRRVAEEILPILTFGMHLLLFLAVLVLITNKYQYERYLWLLGCLFFSLISSSGIFIDEINFIEKILPVLLYCAGSAAILLMAFVISTRWNYVAKAILIWAFLMPIAGYYVTGAQNFSVLSGYLYFVLPSILCSLVIAIFYLSKRIMHQPDLAIAVLVAALGLILIGSVHDILLRIDVLSGSAPIATSARAVLMAGLGIYLMLNISNMNSELSRAAAHLVDQVRSKEIELQAFYQAEIERTSEVARREQQANMTADLHDGLAGRLSTIVALADSSKPNVQAIESAARAALEELRLVIDSSAADSDLRSALAGLWLRMLKSFEHMDVYLTWDMIDLPESPDMSIKQKLCVLHILQEAIFNAFYHGKPNQISVVGGIKNDGMSEIRVENSGGVALVQFTRSGGYGVLNMSSRANSLGGGVVIEATDTGAILMLTYPTI